ncbi:MAG TPA: hypothetical protein VI790_00285 [Candidatus Nanoarchaeia archaeon]|nr:hypothetical protein [Candidatus Nanoarchaeia archaeon]
MLLKEVDFFESLLSVKFPELRDGMALYHSTLIFDSNWDSRKKALFLINHDLESLFSTLESKSHFFVSHSINLLNASYSSYFGERLFKPVHYTQLMDYCFR